MQERTLHDKFFNIHSFHTNHFSTSPINAQTGAQRDQLYDLFSYNRWQSLSPAQRKGAVQSLENDFAQQQGRPAKEIVFESMDKSCYGGWSNSANKIFLNKSLVENDCFTYNGISGPHMPDANIQIFDTIAHEGYHAYQSHALEHPEIHDDKQQLREWAQNEGKYYNSGNEYLIQPQERDAWQYGHQQTTSAYEGIEQRNGSEPGREEYESQSNLCSYDNALQRAQARDPEVLHHMDFEMQTACNQKGINYSFYEEQGSTHLNKSSEQYNPSIEEEQSTVYSNKSSEQYEPRTEMGDIVPESRKPEKETKLSNSRTEMTDIAPDEQTVDSQRQNESQDVSQDHDNNYSY